MLTAIFVVAIAAVAAYVLGGAKKSSSESVPILSRRAGEKQPEPVPDADSFESIMLLKRRLKLSGATPQQIHSKLDPLILQLLDEPLSKEAVAAAADPPAVTTGAVTK